MDSKLTVFVTHRLFMVQRSPISISIKKSGYIYSIAQ